MVTAPAKTGRDRSKRIAVISTDQAKRGIFSKVMPSGRKFPRVEIKFTAPKREEIPAKCKEKIAKSTDMPPCAIFLLKGG